MTSPARLPQAPARNLRTGGKPGPADTVPAAITDRLPAAQSRAVALPQPGDRPAALSPGEIVLSKQPKNNAPADHMQAMAEELERTGKVEGIPAAKLPRGLLVTLQALLAAGDEQGDPNEAAEGFACGGKVGFARGGEVPESLADQMGRVKNQMAVQRAQQQSSRVPYQGGIGVEELPAYPSAAGIDVREPPRPVSTNGIDVREMPHQGGISVQETTGNFTPSQQWAAPGGAKGPGTALQQAARPALPVAPAPASAATTGMAGKSLAVQPPAYVPPDGSAINVPPGGFKAPGTDLVPAGQPVTTKPSVRGGIPEELARLPQGFGAGVGQVARIAGPVLAGANEIGRMKDEGVFDPSQPTTQRVGNAAGAVGRLAAAGAGAATLAPLGAAAGPAAPIAIPVMGAIGGIAGYMGADAAIQGGREALSDIQPPPPPTAKPVSANSTRPAEAPPGQPLANNAITAGVEKALPGMAEPGAANAAPSSAPPPALPAAPGGKVAYGQDAQGRTTKTVGGVTQLFDPGQAGDRLTVLPGAGLVSPGTGAVLPSAGGANAPGSYLPPGTRTNVYGQVVDPNQPQAPTRSALETATWNASIGDKASRAKDQGRLDILLNRQKEADAYALKAPELAAGLAGHQMDDATKRQEIAATQNLSLATMGANAAHQQQQAQLARETLAETARHNAAQDALGNAKLNDDTYKAFTDGMGSTQVLNTNTGQVIRSDADLLKDAESQVPKAGMFGSEAERQQQVQQLYQTMRAQQSAAKRLPQAGQGSTQKPPWDVFKTKAMAANPHYSEQEIKAIYEQKYGR